MAADEITGSEEAGIRSAKHAEILITELTKERRALADRYQARVKPVTEFSFG